MDDTEELKKKLEEQTRMNQEISDKIKYLGAEIDNYKKQLIKEFSQKEKLASIDIIKQMLPFLDTLESAMKHDENIKILYKNFFDILEKNGLKKIETKMFDPDYHEAMMVENGEEENKILEVLQEGYMVNDIVIRYAKVKVTKKSEDD